MNIALIIWKIKKGKEHEFLRYWKKLVPNPDNGLSKETLCKVTDDIAEKYKTWNLTNPKYTTFINVGIWRSIEDFEKSVGQYIKDSKNKESFEYEVRERRILTAVDSHKGTWLQD